MAPAKIRNKTLVQYHIEAVGAANSERILIYDILTKGVHGIGPPEDAVA